MLLNYFRSNIVRKLNGAFQWFFFFMPLVGLNNNTIGCTISGPSRNMRSLNSFYPMLP